ncbi:hypothetical protein Desti_3567 [Desulfomonile tiedjei DSM 6799]|uniref:Uncharacterized protein n=1 Tax=Desulfomonile tiedjei (strain ATCC 49306 / DSM 6799 / DCB-1) TaxID=706587 RepID=I4C9H5_DESTA|nr:hypothetical protein Desti_3567 [Desulfomonile tiedjei DSM 6799]
MSGFFSLIGRFLGFPSNRVLLVNVIEICANSLPARGTDRFELLVITPYFWSTDSELHRG